MSTHDRGPQRPPEHPLKPYTVPTPAEEQPEKARATATYRVHMIIAVEGEEGPTSYRTEVQARNFHEAWHLAHRRLAVKAEREQWTSYEVLTRGSCYKVPGNRLEGEHT